METSECTICNLCENPGTLERATEVNTIFCHIRSHRHDSFTVWRCINCGSLHSREPVDLEFYYSDYPLKMHRLDFHTRVGYQNRIRRMKRLGITPAHSIIDVGCGKGLFIDVLKQAGYDKVVGFDTFVERYSDRSVLNGQYDVVMSFDVIEHVENPGEFLSMMIGMVKSGGMLYVGTPNASEIDLFEEPAPPELSQPFHRHIFSEQALADLARKQGLVLVQTDRRSYFDTFVPAVNLRFMWACLHASGSMFDSAMEPPPWGKILRSPRLVFLGLFGYFLRNPGNMTMTFRKQSAHVMPEEIFEPQAAVGNG